MDMFFPDPPIYVFSRTCVHKYVFTLAMYWFKYKEVSTALTLVFCASLNMDLSLFFFSKTKKN